MPAPAGLRRATINASINEGETMAHNIYYRDVSVGGNFDLQDHADTIRNAWATMITQVVGGTSLASGLHTSTVYTDVKLYDIDPSTGRTADLAQATFDGTVKGLATGALPTEVALCVTLETGQPGRTKRGRIYLGGFVKGLLVDATGRFPLSNTTPYATALALFLQQSRDQVLDIDAFRPVVYSRTTQSTLPITRVSIGDVWDVQRRRRNNLVEARGGANVPNPT